MKKNIIMKNKLAIIALASLMIVGAVGGSFAYFSQTAKFENPFQTGDYSTTVTESFTPPDSWLPGQTVDKDLKISTGDVAVAVRVSYVGAWKDAADTDITSAVATVAGNLSLADTDAVAKMFSNSDKWVSESGYYYYKEIVPANTAALELGSIGVTLSDKAENGNKTVTTTYVKAFEGTDGNFYIGDGSASSTEQVTITSKNGVDVITGVTTVAAVAMKAGTSASYYPSETVTATTLSGTNLVLNNCKYTLTVTVETIQGDAAAVEGAWGSAAKTAVGL